MAVRVQNGLQTSIPRTAASYNTKEEPNKQEEKPVVVSQQSQSSRFSQSSDVRSQQQYQHQHSTGPTSGHRAVSASYMSSGDSPMSTHHSSHARNGGGNNSSANGSGTQRKQGVVEKLLHSYGFIDSEVQKDGHLFFHYSEVLGDVNTLETGDRVEFNLSYDYRSSRWLAVSVTKVEAALTVSKDQFSGVIFKKAEPQEKFKSVLDRSGRISYEQSGEMFFIPYSTLDLEEDDVPSNQMPAFENQVTFYIATDKKTGHMWATCVKQMAAPPMSQGVVCSLKENFGFIERADLVKEIFFHYSEYSDNIAELVLGDDVEFSIQTRNNKEVATNIRKLTEGTVVFEDVSTEKLRGKIAKVIKATRKHAEPLAGSISYETQDGDKEIAYSERDISGEFTLFVGDVVDFQIAKDRRDGLIHATSVTLCEESFVVSKEKRDKGVVSSVKESYGFLQILSPDCGTGIGDIQLFFHFNELYESVNTPVVVGDEIEFTIAYDPNNKSKPIAIRIRKLAKGSIRQNQVVSSQTYTGSVIQDQPSKSSKKSAPGTGNGDTGVIRYPVNGKEHSTIVYLVKDADLRYGDKVSFNVCEMKNSCDTSVKRAVNIKLLSRLGLQTGFICSLKDSYGFIETVSIDDEIFFHFSCYNGEFQDINIGDVVEYNLACRNKKVSAEGVTRAPKDKLSVQVDGAIQQGTITRAIANTSISGDNDTAYCGLITTEQEATSIIYPFGFISLYNKRSCPAVDTVVEFQVAKVIGSIERAVNIISMKDIVTARVDSIKGQYGFLQVEEREKKVYFSMTDIQDGSSLSVGDNVKCVIMPLVGSNRISAVYLRKIKAVPSVELPVSARPERLISKLKTQMSMSEGPKVALRRLNYSPDGRIKPFSPLHIRAPLYEKFGKLPSTNSQT